MLGAPLTTPRETPLFLILVRVVCDDALVWQGVNGDGFGWVDTPLDHLLPIVVVCGYPFHSYLRHLGERCADAATI